MSNLYFDQYEDELDNDMLTEYESSFDEYQDDYPEPSPEEIDQMFKCARIRWPYADERSISNYVNMKLDGYPERQCQVQSGFADPPYDEDD